MISLQRLAIRSEFPVCKIQPQFFFAGVMYAYGNEALLLEDVNNVFRKSARNIKRSNLFWCARRKLNIELVSTRTQGLSNGGCGGKNKRESLHVSDDIPLNEACSVNTTGNYLVISNSS